MGAGEMFHVKRKTKGYYSADFFCETFSVIESVKVIQVIQGYGEIGSLITFYNPVAHVCYSMLEIARRRIITFTIMFPVKHDSIHPPYNMYIIS